MSDCFETDKGTGVDSLALLPEIEGLVPAPTVAEDVLLGVGPGETCELELEGDATLLAGGRGAEEGVVEGLEEDAGSAGALEGVEGGRDGRPGGRGEGTGVELWGLWGCGEWCVGWGLDEWW